MNMRKKEILYITGICTLAALIPFLLIIYGFQTKRYQDLLRDIKELERNQEVLIEQNKKLVSDISLLASSDRIEKIASEELGMHKAESEDIVRVEMNGGKDAR